MSENNNLMVEKEINLNNTSNIIKNEEDITNNAQDELISNDVAEVTKVAEEKIPFSLEETEHITFDGKKVKTQCLTSNINGNKQKFIIPYKYKIDERGYIFYCETNKKGDNNPILMSDCLILPTKVVKNKATDEEKLEISILKDRQWKQKIYSKTTLYSKPIELANLGIKITSENSRLCIKYIVTFEIENAGNLPIAYSVDSLGWVDNKTFALSDEHILIDLNTNGYIEKGSMEMWKDNFESYRINPILRFILAAAFAASLLRILEERSFMIYIVAPSRSGKTALLMAAMSVWGDPNDLISTYNTTQVGLERRLYQNNDLPVAIDERQIADSQKLVEKLVFTMGSERGRVRGNKQGGLSDIYYFKNIVLSTGEEPLARNTSTTGVSTRCLEIEETGFNNEDTAAGIYKIVSKCYGVAGKFFIKKLIDEYSKDNYDGLIKKFEEIKNKLSETTTANISSYITDVAVVILADILVSEWIFEDKDIEESISLGQYILNKLNKSEDIDVTEKAYQYVCNYLISNHSGFNQYKTCQEYPEDDVLGNSYNSLGIYNANTYYIFPHSLEKILTDKGYSYHKTIREFAKKGYILCENYKDSSFKTCLIQKKYRNKNVRMIAFPMKPAENN